MPSSIRWGLVSLLSVLLCTGLFAGALLKPVPAPEWKASEWLNGNPGQLANQRGKVVLIGFFQVGSLGCKQFSIPLLQRWDGMYGGRDDVTIVSIHSEFESEFEEKRDGQTRERIADFVRENGIGHPVGLDAYESPGDLVPITMQRFEAEGTPHVVIVDKQGNIVFSHFGFFDPLPVEALIERLTKEQVSKLSTRVAAPESPPERRPARPEKKTRGGLTTPARALPPPARPQPDDNAKVSGTYSVTFEQTDKSCGDPIAAMDLTAELTVAGERVEIRSARPFLGLRAISASYDPGSGRFQASTTEKAKEQDAEFDLQLELSGAIRADAEPPEIEYEFTLEMSGTDPAANCTIRGRGQGQLSKARGD